MENWLTVSGYGWENYSTRRERAEDDLGPNYEKWLRTAWNKGYTAGYHDAGKAEDDPDF